MIVLSAKNLNKSYDNVAVLRDVSFHINEGERVGLIGDNGAGKTTLLRLLTGEETPDSGELYRSGALSLGYLKQRDSFDPSLTVHGAALLSFKELIMLERDIALLSSEITTLAESAGEGPDEDELNSKLHRLDALQQDFDKRGGYRYKSDTLGILASMGFSDMLEKRVESLSGGERTRLALACLLLEKPDILLLDEPTNHLDIESLSWLEQYLRGYKGTLLLISHDRYFLEHTASRIFELENKRLSIYNCKYSEYAKEKDKRREAALKAYEKQQTEIARQEEIIRRFKQHGTEHLAKRAASREKALSHMELIERPEALRKKVRIEFKQDFKSGRDVLKCEGLSKGFGLYEDRRELFHDVSFDIRRGERVCLIGPNGVGKTTLLKMFMGRLRPDSGYIDIGYNVEFGYYDQEQRLLNDSASLLEEMKESYRLYSDTEMRSILGRFLFTGDDVFKSVSSLSGGERARLSLLKLMLSNANVLLLDEPTNHLDISSKEVFEDALLDFPGTVITVTHDRYYLNKLATRIIELTSEGVREYPGGYDYYLRKKAESEPEERKEPKEEKEDLRLDLGATGNLSSAELRRLKKEEEAKERRKQREIERLETEIALLESESENLENLMSLPENASDHELLTELSLELTKKKSRLEEAYAAWEELNV